MVAYHLEGEAQLWYQLLKEEEEHITWEKLKEGLHRQYGPTNYEDFFGNLTELRQTGSVHEYQSQFERMLSRVGKMTQTQQVGCFVSGLKETILADIQALRPTSLSAAIGLTRLYEAKFHTQRRSQPPAPTRAPWAPTSSPTPSRVPTIKKLSPVELQ